MDNDRAPPILEQFLQKEFLQKAFPEKNLQSLSEKDLVFVKQTPKGFYTYCSAIDQWVGPYTEINEAENHPRICYLACGRKRNES